MIHATVSVAPERPDIATVVGVLGITNSGSGDRFKDVPRGDCSEGRPAGRILLATALGVVLGLPSAAAAEKPHNILLIECDSMDGRAMGCIGHPALKRATPHLDALARQGALFRIAYTNNPICCPSRASMFSGLQTHRCEAWNNYKGLAPGAPTLMDRLAAAGYCTKTLGKTDYVSGGHSQRARVSAWTRSAGIERPNYREAAPEILDRDEPRVHASDWQTAAQAVAWLKEHGAGGKPFFLSHSRSPCESSERSHRPETLRFRLREPYPMRRGDLFDVIASSLNWSIHDNIVTGCQQPVMFDSHGGDTCFFRNNVIERGGAAEAKQPIVVTGRFQLDGNQVVGFDEKRTPGRKGTMKRP